MSDDKIVSISEVKREDALETPLTALKNIIQQIENGELNEPSRMALVLDDGEIVDVFGSGEKNDAIQSLGLLTAAQGKIQQCMIGDAE